MRKIKKTKKPRKKLSKTKKAGLVVSAFVFPFIMVSMICNPCSFFSSDSDSDPDPDPDPAGDEPSGTISASPNPCIIASGETTCSLKISWTTKNVESARVYVSGALFAEGTSGSKTASDITTKKSNFNLYEYNGDRRGELLDSVTVRGRRVVAVARDYTATINFQGGSRTYDVHIPAKYNDGLTPLPLVAVLHCGTDIGAVNTKEWTQMSPKADQEGFVVIYPHALNGGWWNSGYLPAGLRDNDVGYIRAVIDELESELELTGDVFIAGCSSGGFMAYRAASEIAGISAFADVSGAAGGYWTSNVPAFKVSAPAETVPAIIIHGRLDSIIPYDGGIVNLEGKRYDLMSTPESVKLWAGYNGAGTTPTSTSYLRGGGIKFETYTSGSARSEVAFYTLMQSDHDWPGSSADQDKQMNATDYIWDFFEAHKKY